jgi:hypothetical protein
MFRFTHIALIAVILVSVLAESCRKGDNDPFLSLRSRKARVAGSWTLTTANGTTTIEAPDATTSEAWTFDGTSKHFTNTFTDGHGTVTSDTSLAYKLLYTFDKDGTFVMIETDRGEQVTKRGTWDFNAGPANEARTQLILTVTAILNPGSTTLYEGMNCPVQVFDINELRNKKMVLISEGSVMDRGALTTKKALYVLEQE